MTPPRLTPMLASTGSLPAGEGWVAEVKWDGFRLLATVEGDRLRLTTRPGSDATAWFPELAELPPGLRGHEAVLDGEVIVCNDRGRPDFHLLRRRIGSRRHELPGRRVTYCVFDLLWLDGEALWRRPWHERRRLLDDLGLASAAWQVPAYFPGDDLAEVGAATARLGLEGVVVKRRNARYQPGGGRRTGSNPSTSVSTSWSSAAW